MTPLDIITLEQAKDHLVVDYPDRDAEIERHIKTAIGFIEKYTNIMMYEREVTYRLNGCGVEIYDYPFQFVSLIPASRVRNNALSITVYGERDEVITATVGYSNVADVPAPLIEAAYKMITYLFENKDIYSAGLPWDVQMLLNPYRRSATI